MISLSGSVLQIIFGAALDIYQLAIYQKQRKIALFLYISKCFSASCTNVPVLMNSRINLTSPKIRQIIILLCTIRHSYIV